MESSASSWLVVGSTLVRHISFWNQRLYFPIPQEGTSKPKAVKTASCSSSPTSDAAYHEGNNMKQQSVWVLDSIGRLLAKSWCLFVCRLLEGRTSWTSAHTKKRHFTTSTWLRAANVFSRTAKWGESFMDQVQSTPLLSLVWCNSVWQEIWFHLSTWVLPIVYVLPLRMHPYTLEFWRLFVCHSDSVLGAWQDGKRASQPEKPLWTCWIKFLLSISKHPLSIA